MLKSRQAAIRRRRALQERSALYFPSPKKDAPHDNDALPPVTMLDWQDALHDPEPRRAKFDDDDLAAAV